MDNHRIAVSCSVAVLGIVLCESSPADVTLTSLNRYQSSSTQIDPALGGEFNQITAPPGYDVWNDVISASSTGGGSSSSTSGTFTSPLVTPDSISVTLTADASATCNHAGWVSSQTLQQFNLAFDVVGEPAVLILNSTKQQTFDGHGQGIANMSLEQTTAPFDFLWTSGFACGDPIVLIPGSYILTVDSNTEAYIDGEIGVSASHSSVIDVAIVSAVPQVFEFDTTLSALDLDIQVPGMPLQEETVHFGGSVSLVVTRCEQFGYDLATLVDMNLVMQQSQLTIQTAGDPVTLANVSISPSGLGGASVLDSACCGLTDGCCATLTNYEFDALASLSAPMQARGNPVVWGALLICVLQLFFEAGDPDPPSRLASTGPIYDAMSFPGINIVDSPLDLGLGAMNPTVTITGHIEGTLKPDTIACPADADDDGKVGIEDFLAVLAQWGQVCPCTADSDDDGMVGILDFLKVLADWGACP